MSPTERLEHLSKALSPIGFPLPRFAIGDRVDFIKPGDGPFCPLIVAEVKRSLKHYPDHDGDEWEFTEWMYCLWYATDKRYTDMEIHGHGDFNRWGWIQESRLVSLMHSVEADHAQVVS